MAYLAGKSRVPSASRKHLILLAFVVVWMIAATFSAHAQDTPQQPPANPNQQEAPPEAGGPQNDVGPYVIPKKKEEPPPPAPEKPKKIENMPDYSITVNVPVVDLDVLVTTKDGQTIPGLKKENFKIMEDGAPQQISTFNQTEAPITAVLLVEFASTNYDFIVEALNASYAFANTLKKDDWVAVISYDMKPQILADFTQDKRAVDGGVEPVAHAGFFGNQLVRRAVRHARPSRPHRGQEIHHSGHHRRRHFQQAHLDQIFKKIKSTKDVTIYPISVGFMAREYCEVHHCRTRGYHTGRQHGLPASG